MVQQDQIKGNATEDPKIHLANFLEICDRLKVNRESEDTIKLCLFYFCLRDQDKIWLHSFHPNSFTTWVDLSKVFLNKYFLPAKAAKLHIDITSFSKSKGESLYESWERFKELFRKCSHHRLPKW